MKTFTLVIQNLKKSYNFYILTFCNCNTESLGLDSTEVIWCRLVCCKDVTYIHYTFAFSQLICYSVVLLEDTGDFDPRWRCIKLQRLWTDPPSVLEISLCNNLYRWIIQVCLFVCVFWSNILLHKGIVCLYSILCITCTKLCCTSPTATRTTPFRPLDESISSVMKSWNVPCSQYE